ncbi:hypothetical protein [Aeromonas caviae]|uniref:hypothetical protein n=1 Tax=Aeromonas caviae TaxID=648 RepID=UPI0029DE68C6|nr:hypothetical protein [Aeromonas caviae]MDX7645908.1 hypothetical protein [Aeromonas caviae]
MQEEEWKAIFVRKMHSFGRQCAEVAAEESEYQWQHCDTDTTDPEEQAEKVASAYM